MKKDIEITLKKDGSNDIIIKCPLKIKLHPVAAWFALSYGLPPAKINPVQGKDVLKAYALFACIFLSLVFNSLYSSSRHSLYFLHVSSMIISPRTMVPNF